jgi:hypothetical protein
MKKMKRLAFVSLTAGLIFTPAWEEPASQTGAYSESF